MIRPLVMLSAALAAAGCSASGPSSGNTPQEMFEHVIRRPVPAGVTDLQGCGDTWQGYSLNLRFRATDEVIASLLADGYKLAKWEDIAWRFELDGPAYSKQFDPPWDPAGVGVKECFEAATSNQWTGSGTHYLVIDRRNGTVYFYGVGS